MTEPVSPLREVAEELWRRFMAEEYGPSNVAFVEQFLQMVADEMRDILCPRNWYSESVRASNLASLEKELSSRMLKRLEKEKTP